MAKRILVPLDRETEHDAILPIVADIARGGGATIRMLQTLAIEHAVRFGEPVPEILAEARRAVCPPRKRRRPARATGEAVRPATASGCYRVRASDVVNPPRGGAEHTRTSRRPYAGGGKTMNALTLKAVVTMIGLTLMSGTAPVWAQSPADPHHQPAAAPAAAPDAVQAPHDGGTMPMMDMCRQMMAGPMPGMGRDQMAHMLEMRGEMMKAMGEVMMKHGKMMMQGDAPK